MLGCMSPPRLLQRTLSRDSRLGLQLGSHVPQHCGCFLAAQMRVWGGEYNFRIILRTQEPFGQLSAWLFPQLASNASISEMVSRAGNGLRMNPAWASTRRYVVSGET
jgi:hypothetical protein